jgi:NDP-sugar pyrophosphorylase family protein
VILAGGLGTRLWPLTSTVSKPMVPVAGRPYLHYQLTNLRDQGVSEILLLTGYLGEQIEQHFGNGTSLGLSISYSREEVPLGTGGALLNAAALLAPEFLLIYGDSYLPIQYQPVCERFEQTKSQAVIVIYDNSIADTSVRNNIAVDAECLVTRYQKNRPHGDLKYVDAGVLALRRSALDLLPRRSSPISLEEELYPELIAAGHLSGYITATRFFDIGTPERLQAFEAYLLNDHHQNTIQN